MSNISNKNDYTHNYDRNKTNEEDNNIAIATTTVEEEIDDQVFVIYIIFIIEYILYIIAYDANIVNNYMFLAVLLLLLYINHV